VFQKGRRERRYKATFIDQGYCFHAGDWKFIDASLGGVFNENTVYREVTGWPSFEPWLSRIESFPAETAWAIAEVIPPGWYGGDRGSAGAVAGAACAGPRADHGIQGIEAAAVSQLGCGRGKGAKEQFFGGGLGAR
jgi:hypothetical protein